MSKKELQEMKKALERQHAEVTKSKGAAKKLLLKLNLITSKGNLTTVFKPVKLMYPASPGLLIGFHGCDKSVRNKIVNDQSMLHDSRNDYDWLGNGMYFWENNRQRAFD